MPEHYTKNTVEASCWCLKCNKMTPHRVDDGRRGTESSTDNKVTAQQRRRWGEMRRMGNESRFPSYEFCLVAVVYGIFVFFVTWGTLFLARR